MPCTVVTCARNCPLSLEKIKHENVSDRPIFEHQGTPGGLSVSGVTRLQRGTLPLSVLSCSFSGRTVFNFHWSHNCLYSAFISWWLLSLNIEFGVDQASPPPTTSFQDFKVSSTFLPPFFLMKIQVSFLSLFYCMWWVIFSGCFGNFLYLCSSAVWL